MRRDSWIFLALKASPLLIPIVFVFYNPNREVKLPPDSKIISIVVGEKNITDRLTILQTTNIVFQYNRSYWESGIKTCPTPKVTATFEVEKGSPPLALLFGADWVCAHGEFGGRIQNILWHVPPDAELKLRRLLAVNA